jgi:hypothetical protein
VLFRHFFILALTLMFVGCASTKTKTYDKSGFPITNLSDVSFKTTLKTGVIKTGHSGWISTTDFADGKDPEYYCAEKQRHSWSGELWMFELQNQKEILKNLNAVLISNNIYDQNSENEIIIDFEKIYQGEQDQPIYTFEINVTIVNKNSIIYSKRLNVVGNDMSEEYWTTDSWPGAKKRATNRVIEQIVTLLNSQANSIGI